MNYFKYFFTIFIIFNILSCEKDKNNKEINIKKQDISQKPIDLNGNPTKQKMQNNVKKLEFKKNDISVNRTNKNKKKELKENEGIDKIEKNKKDIEKNKKDIEKKSLPELGELGFLIKGEFLRDNARLTPFDPFGLKNYSSVYYDSNISNNIIYKYNNIEKKIVIDGQKWNLRKKFKTKEEYSSYKNNLHEKIKLLQRIILVNNKERILVKSKNNEEEEIIYIDIRLYEKSIDINVYKKRFLRSNKSINFSYDKNKQKDKNLLYNLKFDGKHFYYLEVEANVGKIDGNIRLLTNGDLKINKYTHFSCNASEYKKCYIYNLPQYGGKRILYLETTEDKTNATIKLVKTKYLIPELSEYSSLPGILNVKNTNTLDMKAIISAETTNDRFDIDVFHDYSPDGDAIYWLNSGLYHLEKKSNNIKFNSNLLPIVSNYQTTVNWPIYYDDEEKNKKEKDQITNKMVIYDVKKNKNKVSLDFSISHLPKNIELNKKDFHVFEGGSIEGKILSLDRLKKPMNIYILLDSSGSMKKDIKTAINSVDKFIKKLPENTNVKLVDFDTKVKLINSQDKNDLLKKLKRIKAGGATSLYDSIILGVNKLKNKSRASIVLFTDGKDANYNDTKRGSKADFETMINTVKKNKIPIYPIAFGNNADIKTLNSIAKITKTHYYQGNDEKSLDTIFEEIKNILSSAYRLSYEQGKVSKNSSQAVINFMIDVSGSMDSKPSNCEGCGFRIQQVKKILQDSIEELPEDKLIQLSTFSTDVETAQILTSDKAKLLSSLRFISRKGGTKILLGVEKGLYLTKNIPSNRRYFIFFTDAAENSFKFDEKDNEKLNNMLKEFKDNNISSFWIGMVENEKVIKNMEMLAQKSDGESFVSSDINKIKDKILEITKKIKDVKNQKQEAGVINLNLKKRNKENGNFIIALGEKTVKHKIPIDEEKEKIIEGENYNQDKTKFKSKKKKSLIDMDYEFKKLNLDKEIYSLKNSKNIYGEDLPLKEVKIQKILNDENKKISRENKAMKIEVGEILTMNKLKGLDAQSSYEYLLINLKLINKLKEQKVAILKDGDTHPSSWITKSKDDYRYKYEIPTYLIPNFKNHIFVEVNNFYTSDFHPLTWALEKPLINIDQTDLYVYPKINKEGYLCFKVPKKTIKNLSIHFYDTNYGHIHIPIIGKLGKYEKINDYPKTNLKKLSDSFAMKIESVEYKNKLNIKAKKDGIFEILNINLESKVNALLDINPKERFALKIKTKNGDFFIPPSPVTKNIPMGFYKKLSISPGSNNRFSMAFHIPEQLKNYPQALHVDIKGENKEIPIKIKNVVQEKENNIITKAGANKIKLLVNDIYHYYNKIYLDITLEDEKDNFSTRLKNYIVISEQKKNDFKTKKGIKTQKGLGSFGDNKIKDVYSTNFIKPDNTNYILQCNNIAIDGLKKRCILRFNYSKLKLKNEEKEVYLVSEVFKDLNYAFKLKDLKKFENKKHKKYFVEKINYNYYVDENYKNKLEKILSKVKHKRMLLAKKSRSKKTIDLDEKKNPFVTVNQIPINLSSSKKLEKIKNNKDFIEKLKKLKFIPSYNKCVNYSSSSIFTQNYANEYEMQNALFKFIARNNYNTESGYAYLNEKGIKELKKLTNQKIENNSITYIKWGTKLENSITFPFFKTLEKMKELVSEINKDNIEICESDIEIELHYKEKLKGTNSMMGAMGSSLSGKTKSKDSKIRLLDYRLENTKLSDMPIDIYFIKSKKNNKETVKTNLYFYDGFKTKDIELKHNIILEKMIIHIRNGDNRVDSRVITFDKKESIEDIFLTIALNTPDINKKVFKDMEFTQKNILKGLDFKNIEPISKLQMINRTKIYNFAFLQTLNNKELAKKLKLQISHHRNPRVIISTIRKKGDSIISSLDLRRVEAQAYGKELDINSFNLVSGLFSSLAEAKALNNSKNIFQRWKKDQRLLMMYGKKNKFKEALKKNKIPNNIIDRYNKSKSFWIFPLDNKNDYAWLEINPENYKLISVLENGEYGAAESAILEKQSTTFMYYLGILIGNDVAIGSVINTSLMYDNYEKIRKEAEQMAKTIACYLKKFQTVKNLASGDIKNIKKPKGTQEAINTINGVGSILSVAIDCDNDMPTSLPPSSYSDYINFGEGIDRAINNYFK